MGADSESEKNIGDIFRLLLPNCLSVRKFVSLISRMYCGVDSDYSVF